MQNKYPLLILGAVLIFMGYTVKDNINYYLEYDPEFRQSYTSTIEKLIEFQSRICLSTKSIEEDVHEKELEHTKPIEKKIKEEDLEQAVYACVYSNYNMLSPIISDFSKWMVTRKLISEYFMNYNIIPEELEPYEQSNPKYCQFDCV